MLEQWNRRLQSHPRLAGGLLFLTTYVVFSGTLSNLFVHDDIPQVLDNPFLRNIGLWTRIFTGSVWSFRGPAQHDNMYRPLQFITYWALYRLDGPNPVVFHLFLLLFYAASVWLVFLLAKRLMPNSLVAFAGALLWALHPLHVETAAWISALPDLGAAFFYIARFSPLCARRTIAGPAGRPPHTCGGWLLSRHCSSRKWRSAFRSSFWFTGCSSPGNTPGRAWFFAG